MARYVSPAFVYHGRPKDVSRGEISFGCGPRELVVEVILCARCGTDRTIYRKGHPNVDRFAPVVLGHELVARIVEVGDRVRDLTEGIGYREGMTLPREYLDFVPGERVVFQSRIARYDRYGLMLIANPIANLSFQINGGFARFMRVTEELVRSESVLRVPDCVTDEEACLVEPAACALESTYATPHPVGVEPGGRHIYRAGVREGGSVCIIGSGTVGMLYAAIALAEGAARVVVVVRSHEKKAQITARLHGAVEAYISPRISEEHTAESDEAEQRVVTDLMEMTDGYLFDDVVAACASVSAQRLMPRLYTREGYAVGACFGGTHALVDGADIDANHYRAAKTIGTSGCSTACMKTILELLAADRLDFTGLLASRRFTLDDDPHEFFTTEAEGLKPALDPSGSPG